MPWSIGEKASGFGGALQWGGQIRFGGQPELFPRTMSLSRPPTTRPRTNAATGKPALLALLAMLLAGCGGEEANNMARFGGGPPLVVTESVLLGDITDNYTALATARANEAIDVTPRVSSVVSAIRFEEGQSVGEGEVLVELDSREIRADLDLAEANLRERRSRYGRLETLAASQVVSEVELEEIQAQLQVAEAQVNSARARLEDTIIRAPFSGEVGLRRISIGGLVQPNTVITTLDDTAVMKIEFSVPEEYLVRHAGGPRRSRQRRSGLAGPRLHRHGNQRGQPRGPHDPLAGGRGADAQ